MSGPLTHKQGGGCRLELAKEAILMFYSKLRPNDSFGLVVFNNKGTTILPVQTVAERDFEEVSACVKNISTNGGTTLITGFEEANKILSTYLKDKNYVKNNSAENRFIMLTDVCDNSVSTAKKFIE